MDSSKITFVVLLVSLPAVAGFSCLRCQTFEFNTNYRDVQDYFRSLGLTEYRECRGRRDLKTTKIPVEQCSGATSEEISACAVAQGSGTAVALVRGGVSVDFTYTAIGCDNIPKSKKDRCEPKLPTLPVNVTKFKGHICYCSTDKCNGQNGLVPAVAVFLLNLVVVCILRE